MVAYTLLKTPSKNVFIAALFGCAIIFSAWTWGGVVLWTQWVVAGLGLLTLALALLPSASVDPTSRKRLWLTLGLSIALGLITGGYFAWSDLSLVLTQREATLQLLPDASLVPLTFAQWGLRGLLISLGVTFVSLIIGGLIHSSSQRRRLVRFPFFWLGLFLFAWIACQSWNTWGVVVQRDLFWRILPQDHITWLPSGLDAPFASSEEPGGMNGWRQLLIWVGPWALMCGLVCSISPQKIIVSLATVACLNGLVVGLVGNIYKINKWRDFWGITDPELRTAIFGPFIYRNHAGVYLYLLAGLAGAVSFFLIKRKGDQADKGGLYLLLALSMVLLLLSSASTLSVGAIVVSGLLIVVIYPLAYFSDVKLRRYLSPLPILAVLTLLGALVYAVVDSGHNNRWLNRLGNKRENFLTTGSDDRAPLRRATWDMITVTDNCRQVYGWGAGSYRWVSPTFLRQHPEFLNKRGELRSRATHAHNDWLQLVADCGIAGWFVIIASVAIMTIYFINIARRPSAIKFVICSTLFLFMVHAFFDFLLFIPILLLLALMIAWMETYKPLNKSNAIK